MLELHPQIQLTLVGSPSYDLKLSFGDDDKLR